MNNLCRLLLPGICDLHVSTQQKAFPLDTLSNTMSLYQVFLYQRCSVNVYCYIKKYMGELRNVIIPHGQCIICYYLYRPIVDVICYALQTCSSVRPLRIRTIYVYPVQILVSYTCMCALHIIESFLIHILGFNTNQRVTYRGVPYHQR